MSLLRDFLGKIGLDEETIDLLVSEEPPEDFSIEDRVNNFRNNQKSLFRTLLKPDFEKTITSRIGKVYGKVEDQIRNTFDLEGMGVEIDPDDVLSALEKIKESYEAKIAGGSDDEQVKELQGRVNSLTKSLQTIQNEKKAALKEFEDKIAALETEKEDIKRQTKIDGIFDSIFSKVKWGIPEKQVPAWKNNIKREILSRYHITEDGGLLDKDRENAAANFTNTGVYTSLDQPIEYMVKEYELEQISHGGQGGGEAGGGAGGGGRRKPATDGMSEAAKEMLNRMEKAARKRN